MRRIYLAIAKTDHEGFSVITGFDDEEKADAFCAEATLYDQGKRYCPAMDAPDEEWHEFEEWQSAFYKGHPAGVDNAADEYCVLPVLMAEASALPQVPRRESSDLLLCPYCKTMIDLSLQRRKAALRKYDFKAGL